MRATRLVLFAVLIALAAGCNLSAEPPTPTPQPTATFAPQIVTTPFGLTQPTLEATPVVITLPSGVICTIPAGWIAYTVVSGDSLGLLATQTESTIDELVAANCLDNADSIQVDQVIYLPRQPVIQ